MSRVDFYAGSTLVGSSTGAPFSITWPALAAGSYNLTARATDNLGATTTSASVGISVTAPATSTTLIPKRSSWKYLVTPAAPGGAWASLAFDDSTWLSGAGPLGYGDADVATTVSFGGNNASRYITIYFRTTFPVANAALVTSLTLNLMRDDGAVIYLNGVSVARSNMPSGAVGFSTLASSTVGGAAETTYYAITLPRGALLSGNNVLAVELHQSAANSSDLKLDAELTARP